MPRSLSPHRLLTVLAFSALLAPLAQAQTDSRALLDEFEHRVTTFTLDNGLDFVIIERHDAPVVSFHTYADVGSVNEPAGETGLAHIFEHIAFKGTTSIGTKDIEQETSALQAQEKAYLKLRRERTRAHPDSAKLRRLQAEFDEMTEAAKSYVNSNAFDRILNQAGVTGMNASTWVDATRYFYSLPANKLELFFALESDRFAHPVLREFYTERDVVKEERRMRTESSPSGRLMEEFLSTAFKAHPYGHPTVGHMSDLNNISRTEAKAFFDKYYGPNNLTIAIAGDVDPERARSLAHKYFSRLKSGEEPLPVTTEEPEQLGERRVTLNEQTQPYVFIGYHRPSMFSEDDAAYSVLADVLSQGRTSRFHKNLVETQKALQANAVAQFPGSKYPTLFWIIGIPNRSVAPGALEQDIYDELHRIAEEGVTSEELKRTKTRARASLIQGLDSNANLARQMAQAEALTGDWRSVFDDLDEIERVTRADVQRVARETFTRSNRTVALIKNEGGSNKSASSSAP